MIPSIPDNLYKIIFALGLFLIGYSYLQTQKNSDISKRLSKEFDVKLDSIKSRGNSLDDELKSIKEFSKELAESYNIKNPLISKNGTVIFNQIISGDKNDVVVSNKIATLWLTYKSHVNNFQNISTTLNRQLIEINHDLTYNNSDNEFWSNATGLGAVLFIIGLLGLLYLQTLQNKLLIKQIKIGETFSCCQSCAKTFNSTVQNAKFSDGEINRYYCSECFMNNDFTNPALTPKEVLKDYLKTFEKPNFLLRLISKAKIINLHRWRFGRY
jgi:hypothetical protein